MKKGSAMEGFIREDGTIRPIEHYDDTELRGKIQTNTDKINNNESAIADHEQRIVNLETHGGAEDPTKADKVENATAGNLASLDADGNLQDSGKKPADFALADHEHNHIADFSGENHCGASVSVGEGDQGAGVISLLVKGDGQGSASKTVEIGYYEAENLQRALEDPVKSYDPDSAYSDNKLITAAAVLNKLLGKLDIPDEGLMVKFDVSGGALTLVPDTTEYDIIFGLVEPNLSKIVTTFVGIYYSDGDDEYYKKFFGVAYVDGRYSDPDRTLLEIDVTIYVGGYTIYLNKNVSSGTITVSMDSFAALLAPSQS